MSNTILAVIEPDNYPEEVVNRATWLAKRVDADLRLLMWSDTTGAFVRHIVVLDEAEELAEELRAGELRLLEALRDTASEQGLNVTTTYRNERSLLDAIMSEIESLNPSYVLKGTNYHSPAERATMSDVDWQLIRKVTKPLWFVRPKGFAASPVIIAAVDPTHANDKPCDLDKRILSNAKVLSDDAEHLVILHTYQRLTEIGRRATWAVKPERLPIDELEERIRAEHRELLDKLARDNGIEDSQVHQLPGRPNELLPTFCRSHGADLLIMGAVSRGFFKQRLIGRTAQRTLDHVDCDVLIVHPQIDRASGQQAA